MKLRRISKIVFIGFGILIISILIWCNLKFKLGGVCKLEYCMCGFADVNLKDGKVIIISTPHDSWKCGEIIGEYKEVNGAIQFTLGAEKDKTVINCIIDNIGARKLGGREFDYLLLSSSYIRNSCCYLLRCIKLA